MRITCARPGKAYPISSQAGPDAGGRETAVYCALLNLAGKENIPGLRYIAAMAGYDGKDIQGGDVARILRFWEENGYLRLIRNDSDGIEEIVLLARPVSEQATPSATGHSLVKKERMPMKASKMGKLKDHPDFIEVLREYTNQANHALKRREVDILGYLYSDLMFSKEMLIYLIDTCSMNDKLGIEYIEAVALSWNEKGIRTIEDAKDDSEEFQKKYYSVLRALGINISLTPDLKEWIDKWNEVFDTEMLIMACEETVRRTGKPSFAYVDGILEHWKQRCVRTPAEAMADAAKFLSEKRKGRKKKEKMMSGSFYHFEQRDYDWEALVEELLDLQ